MNDFEQNLCNILFTRFISKLDDDDSINFSWFRMLESLEEFDNHTFISSFRKINTSSGFNSSLYTMILNNDMRDIDSIVDEMYTSIISSLNNDGDHRYGFRGINISSTLFDVVNFEPQKFILLNYSEKFDINFTSNQKKKEVKFKKPKTFIG